MKSTTPFRYFLMALVTLNTFVIQAQSTLSYILDNGPSTRTISLNEGEYKISVSGTFDTATEKYTIEYSEEFLLIDPMSIARGTNPGAAASKTAFTENFDLNMEPRKKVVLTVQIIDSSNDSVKKTYTITFEGIETHRWHTTIGMAAVFPSSTDTYKTLETEGGFEVVQDGSQQKIDAIPVMMFTYLNLKRDMYWGWSGGLGFDTENISVFGGISLYAGHNLVLTGGVALHRQVRLDNKYSPGQIVPEAIESSDLNSKYYRVNPFISLTFTLDRSALGL